MTIYFWILMVVLPSPARADAPASIRALVRASACTSYSWKGRGAAPFGYANGLALSFARSLCRRQTGDEAGKILAAPATGNDRKDALTHYGALFSSRGIPTAGAGAESLVAIYTLGFGEGARESSGLYCEGWDRSAGPNRPSSAGEAGPFQTSYDSITASPALEELYREYLANPDRCLLSAFREKASCRPQEVLGTGAGADYQAFTKSCPAFATEYAMVLMRVLRTHFGPVNRREAEVNKDCFSLLGAVAALEKADPETFCGEMF